MTAERRLLIIDDDEGVRALLQDVAEDSGYQVKETDCADEFLGACQSFAPTLIMVDLMMPKVDGVEILRRLGALSVQADLVLMSGADERVLKTAARLAEGYGLQVLSVLTKPASLDELLALFDNRDCSRFEVTIDSLAEAIDNHEIDVFFQPKISLSAANAFAIEDAEALVRWRHPTRGLIFPDCFIQLAEESQLITPLTERVLRLSLEQMVAWRHQGHDIDVSVNLAPQMLSDMSLPDRLASIVDEFGMPGSSIVIEITERAAMDGTVDVMDILTRFRLKGFGLSMDDFGVGYSSLRELYRMPFNELKIDRSFLCELAKDDDAKTIVRAIVGLAKNLGLSVCAEGVESASDVRFLQSVGCDKCQGYYFSKPLPADEFTNLLDNRHGHLLSLKESSNPSDITKKELRTG